MNTTPPAERCTMLLNKLISVIALVVLVFAECDSVNPHVRSKRTIGVVLKNVGDLFGFDVFRRPAAVAAAPAGTSSENLRKSFTININWNKNRTNANVPAAAPAAAPAPAPAARPAPAAPAAGSTPAAKPAAGPAPAAAPASGASPAAAAAPTPVATSAAAPAPAAPAAGPAPSGAAAAPASGPTTPRKPSGPPTKAQLYVEYVDSNGNAREAREEEEDDDDEDRPKRIQIGLPDYSSVDYNEVKRDLANQGNNDVDHSKEKFKQEFNNFWESSPWTLEHGYKFIIPQGPDAVVEELTKAIPKYQEFDLPKKNARSLKIVHNVKVYHQPAKTETYNDVENQKFYNPGNPQQQQQLHILNEEGVRYIVHQNGKKLPLPSNINAQLLEFFKKKFQADAAAQRKAAVEGQQNAIQSNIDLTTPASISKPYPNEQPEIKEERHIFKVNHYRNDEIPQINYGKQPETINEPEYLKIKEKVEAGPPRTYISVSPHQNLNSYIENARPGQVVKIKIVEPSQGEGFDIKGHGYDDTNDVQKNVKKELEKVTEKHQETEAEHYKKSEDPKIGTFEYPSFDYKEFEKVGYPNYADTKDQDFFRGLSDEKKKNLEDHYHFFGSDRDSRGRDKEQLKAKISDKDDKKKNVDENERSDENTETHSQNIQNEHAKETSNEEDDEDDDEESKVSRKFQKDNVHKEEKGNKDTEEDEEDSRQNDKNEKVIEKDDEDDEDENGDRESGRQLKPVDKEEINEEDDEDDEEVEDEDDESEDRPRLVEKEDIYEEEEDEEVEDQPKSTEKENVTEEEDDDDEEVEDRPKSVEKEKITEEDDEDEEVEDRPKSVEKENITEEDEEEDEEIENDEKESKQRPRIVNNNIKENFEVETFEKSNKPKETEAERQKEASNQNYKEEKVEVSTGHNKDDFVAELDSLIDAHFKDKSYLNEINEEGIKDRLKSTESVSEKDFDDLFSKLGDGMEYEDFYKQFKSDGKFTPSKQNLIDSETKTIHSKEKQQLDSTVVQPLYSGVLHVPVVQELFKSDKPLTVPFDHDYSASEAKSQSAKPRTKRSAESWNEEEDEETAINEFKEETQYVPDRYTLEYNYETPEPQMPDFAKLEAKQYTDDDTLSPKARVSKKENGQKTTWINVVVPVTRITDVRT